VVRQGEDGFPICFVGSGRYPVDDLGERVP
jgi:hypothetical protein